MGVRIVGGEMRGRALAGPRAGSNAIRPTSDRTRESLFNILEHGYPDALTGARVLDLFAGTGAFGCEALSRGASHAIFVEQSAEGRGLIQTNIEALGLQGRTKIFRRNATALGQCQRMKPFDLVFADPPYGKGLGEKALASAAEGGWLAPGALVLVEERSQAGIVMPASFTPHESRVFGDTTIHFFTFDAETMGHERAR